MRRSCLEALVNLPADFIQEDVLKLDIVEIANNIDSITKLICQNKLDQIIIPLIQKVKGSNLSYANSILVKLYLVLQNSGKDLFNNANEKTFKEELLFIEDKIQQINKLCKKMEFDNITYPIAEEKILLLISNLNTSSETNNLIGEILLNIIEIQKLTIHSEKQLIAITNKQTNKQTNILSEPKINLLLTKIITAELSSSKNHNLLILSRSHTSLPNIDDIYLQVDESYIDQNKPKCNHMN